MSDLSGACGWVIHNHAQCDQQGINTRNDEVAREIRKLHKQIIAVKKAMGLHRCRVDSAAVTAISEALYYQALPLHGSDIGKYMPNADELCGTALALASAEMMKHARCDNINVRNAFRENFLKYDHSGRTTEEIMKSSSVLDGTRYGGKLERLSKIIRHSAKAMAAMAKDGNTEMYDYNIYAYEDITELVKAAKSLLTTCKNDEEGSALHRHNRMRTSRSKATKELESLYREVATVKVLREAEAE